MTKELSLKGKIEFIIKMFESILLDDGLTQQHLQFWLSKGKKTTSFLNGESHKLLRWMEEEVSPFPELINWRFVQPTEVEIKITFTIENEVTHKSTFWFVDDNKSYSEMIKFLLNIKNNISKNIRKSGNYTYGIGGGSLNENWVLFLTHDIINARLKNTDKKVQNKYRKLSTIKSNLEISIINGISSLKELYSKIENGWIPENFIHKPDKFNTKKWLKQIEIIANQGHNFLKNEKVDITQTEYTINPPIWFKEYKEPQKITNNFLKIIHFIDTKDGFQLLGGCCPCENRKPLMKIPSRIIPISEL